MDQSSPSIDKLLQDFNYQDISIKDIKQKMPPTGFRPSGFGEEIRQDRYAHITEDGEKETWEEQCSRVASFAASAEEDEVKQEKWFQIFYHLLLNGYMSPGGRIWSNAGSDNNMLDNCFTVGPIPDSKEGWAKMASDLTLITMSGAGWGADLSEIRPPETEIEGYGGGHKAGGPPNVMEFAEGIVGPIRSRGNRRAALWIGLSPRNPYFPEYVKIKEDGEILPSMNISVSFVKDNPEEFFTAVDNGEDWEMEWQHDENPERTITRAEPAAEIWDNWFDSMTTVGDPAIMNFHKINERYNCKYLNGSKIVSCNACSEMPMLPFETCSLSNLVVPKFFNGSTPEDWSLDKEALAIAAAIQTRFLDNLLDIQDYLEQVPEHKKEKKKLRRIGNGIMGLAEAMVKEGIQYSSNQGADFAETVMSTITLGSYMGSTKLAQERSEFPAFNSKGFFDGTFADKRLPTWLKDEITINGIRNSILSDVPPTGTTSLVQGVTGGLEPMQAPAYERRYYDENDELANEVVVNNLYQRYLENGWETGPFESAYGISPDAELKVLERIQKWVDAGTSKTVLIPPTYDDSDLEELIKEWAPKLLSFTFYKVGSKEDQPITPLSEKRAKAEVLDSRSGSIDEVACEGGSCGL